MRSRIQERARSRGGAVWLLLLLWVLVAGCSASGGTDGVTNGRSSQGSGISTSLSFLVQPSNTAQGAPITPGVQVGIMDGNGVLVPTSTDSVTLALGTNPTQATLAGTLTVVAVNGVATFPNLSVDLAGSGYTLSATSTGVSGSASSNTFNVASTPSKLAFSVSPGNSVQGQPLIPTVRVAILDVNNITVPNASNNVTVAIGINPSSGILSGTKTVTAVNGVATFNGLSIDKSGVGYTLTATSSGLINATSAAFNEVGSASAPTQLAFNVQPSNVAANAVISPAMLVVVEDVNGTIVGSASNSVTLTLGANPGGATLAGALTVSAVNGVATFSNVSLNNTGTNYTLIAQAGGLTNATSAQFSVTGAGGGSLGLIELNNLRSLGNLPAVNETASLSSADQAHANWMLLNNKIQHFEDLGSPGYSTAGNTAASKSNLAVWSGTPIPTIQQQIDGLMTAPFHGLAFINPRLLNSGFGYASNASILFPGIDAAVSVDVASSLAPTPPAGTTYPILWPANGKTVPFTSYSGNEIPDPTTSAPGAQGMPIYIQLGSDPSLTNPPLTVSSFSLTQQGVGGVAVSEFDWRNYANPNVSDQATGRALLDAQECIVLMPTLPLVKGATYTVSVNANGQAINWSFSVSNTATPRVLQPAQGQYR